MPFDPNERYEKGPTVTMWFAARDATNLTWATWALKDEAVVWKVVALHSALEPDSFVYSLDSCAIGLQPRCARFKDGLEAAVLHVEKGTLTTVKSADDPCNAVVQLSAYAHWAQSLRLELPLQFPLKPMHAVREANSLWGSHRTKRLDDLMAAAHEFWRPIEEGGRYDLSDPTTAPKNEVVEEWLLRERNVTRKAREVMATILRADGLAPGPRISPKKKGK